jgi:hypothetical protein
MSTTITNVTTSSTSSTSCTSGRRPASETQKARREQRIESLIEGLTEELDASRSDSPRAKAIARSLQQHLNGMTAYIAERLEAEFDSWQAKEIAETVAHNDLLAGGEAWTHVAHRKVDRLAWRANKVGTLLDRMQDTNSEPVQLLAQVAA